MDPARTARARRLRRESTPPERILWSELRNRRLNGLKFRRQQAIGPYTVDFFCAEANLVVEVDGAHHLRTREEDAERDAWLEAEGYRVLRIPVQFLSKSLDDALNNILHSARPR